MSERHGNVGEGERVSDRLAGRNVAEGERDSDRLAGRNVAEGERVSDRLAGETSRQGYPEEAPPGADPSDGGGSQPREGAKAPRKHDDQVDQSDDGKATGNPDSAG